MSIGNDDLSGIGNPETDDPSERETAEGLTGEWTRVAGLTKGSFQGQEVLLRVTEAKVRIRRKGCGLTVVDSNGISMSLRDYLDTHVEVKA